MTADTVAPGPATGNAVLYAGRIKVAAAGINPTDVLLRDPGLGNLAPPLTPGMDASGTVEATGAGVSRLAVGDEVMAALTPMRPEGGAQPLTL